MLPGQRRVPWAAMEQEQRAAAAVQPSAPRPVLVPVLVPVPELRLVRPELPASGPEPGPEPEPEPRLELEPLRSHPWPRPEHPAVQQPRPQLQPQLPPAEE